MNLSDTVRDAIIAAVRKAAAQEILPRYRSLTEADISSKSAPDDLVTAADLATEAYLNTALSEILPDALLLGEEATAEDPSVLDRAATPGHCVIIDPIDGTWNFASGLSTFGVILACTFSGETVFGLLYDPVMDDWIMAERGTGAWYCWPNQTAQKLTLAPGKSIAETSGFISYALMPKSQQPGLLKTFPQFQRIMGLRCSCHEYRSLAQGHGDFMLTGMLKPWDHAAGALILTEAGGLARMLDGRPYQPTIQSGPMLVARDESSWSALKDILAPALL